MAHSASWDKAVADAKKILGNSAKIPTAGIQTVLKRAEELNKVWDRFDDTREVLKKQLLEAQDTRSKIKNALVQGQDQISAEDFGLDEKDPDDKKKIDQAQAIFQKYFATAEKFQDDVIKNLDELDKHLMNLSKYKGPS